MSTAQPQPPGIRGQQGARTAFSVAGVRNDADASFCASCGAALVH